MTADCISQDSLDLVRRAGQWHLISLLFQCPHEGWHGRVADLAAEAGDDLLTEATKQAQDQAAPSLYHTTFGPGGPAPLREVSYRVSAQPGRFISESQGFYDAFAYRTKIAEPPDHLAVQTDFVAFLLLKEAFARSGDKPDEATLCAEAVKTFVEDHLSRIAKPLAESLASSGVGYLSLAAKALLNRTGPPRGGEDGADRLAEFVKPNCQSNCDPDGLFETSDDHV